MCGGIRETPRAGHARGRVSGHAKQIFYYSVSGAVSQVETVWLRAIDPAAALGQGYRPVIDSSIGLLKRRYAVPLPVSSGILRGSDAGAHA